MQQFTTVLAGTQQSALQAARALAHPYNEEWSLLSPTTLSLLMPATQGLSTAERQPNHADIRS